VSLLRSALRFRLGCVLLAGSVACGSSSPVSSLAPTLGGPPAPAATDAPAADGPASSAIPAADDTVPRSGVIVVAVGKVTFTEDDHGRTYSEGGEAALASRSLAKLVYKRPKLRPDTSEDVVQILAGDPPPPGARPSLKEIADLRSGLTDDVDSVASKALLEALAGKVAARAFVLVSSVPPKAPTARLVRVDDVPNGVVIRPDSATFTAVPPADATGDYVWPNVDDAVSALLGPELPVAAGPRKPNGPSDHLKDKPVPDGPKKDDSKPLTESPVFWAIVGGVAALGLTAIIVSQTVDTSTGTVHIQGKVLP
jgi:hypothetical protein